MFKVKRESLLPRLQSVCGAVEKSSIRPILSNVLLKTEGESLCMIAADSEIQMSNSCAVESAKAAQTTVPARKFVDVLRTLDGEAMVEMKLGKGQATLTSGRSRFVLQTMDADDFPLVEEEDESKKDKTRTQIAAAEFKGLLDRVQYAMAAHAHRFYLNGVLLVQTKDTLRAVATDGHRMALDSLPIKSKGDERQVILPRKAVQELARNLEGDDEGEIEVGERHAKFTFGGFSLTSQLVDGNFPDYERVIPKDNKNVMSADRRVFLDSLERVSVLSDAKQAAVRWELQKGKLLLNCTNNEQEEAFDELSVEYPGDKLETAFNVSYLLEVLRHLECEGIKVALKDGSSSTLITPPDEESTFRYVVMPMRL